MLSGGIQENMIKTFETHPPGCAYPGLSVHDGIREGIFFAAQPNGL